jgi:hypothetical protein
VKDQHENAGRRLINTLSKLNQARSAIATAWREASDGWDEASNETMLPTFVQVETWTERRRHWLRIMEGLR